MVDKELNNTSAHAIGKTIKSSQQKANLVLKSIRGLPVENAVNILQFSRRRVANIVLKILKSAISNAENNHQLDIDKLYVKEATVGKSMVLKKIQTKGKRKSWKNPQAFLANKNTISRKSYKRKNNKRKY